MTRFKELCLDTARSDDELGRFWAAVTGCAYAAPGSLEDPGAAGAVLGAEEGMCIALCRVPEEKTVKHRVHLDVHTGSVDLLLALGARRSPGFAGEAWTVLLDPEDGEFCAFERDGELPAYRVYELGVDSWDPRAQATWWAQVFGLQPANDGEDYWWISGVAGMPFESIVFAPVPEAKMVKNRIHWDLYGEVDELVGAGARVLAVLPRWTVLADPEGNEFCVFPPGG